MAFCNVLNVRLLYHGQELCSYYIALLVGSQNDREQLPQLF